MRSIVAWSARLRVLVLGIAVGILVLGAIQLPKAPMDVLPEFSPPYVEIQTEALGLSAEEVEQLITVPLEADLLNGVAWLDSIESESVPGLSSIVLTFEKGTDPIRARQMVAERLTQAHALPNVSKAPVMLQPLSSSNRLMMVSLSSDELSLIDMSVLARWNVRPRLMGVPGVANVAIFGQRERQLQVLVDPERLSARGVSLDEVIQTTGNALWVSPLSFLEASTPGTGGFIDTPNQRLSVQHVFPIDTADDLARVAIDSDQVRTRSITLGDVADVVEDHQPLIGDAVVNDAPGLLLVVEKFPEANTLEVTAAVEDALEAMAPGLEGISIDSTVFRPASFLESAINNLTVAVLVALVLAAAVIAGLLLDWRAALTSVVAIVLSIVAAAVVLLVLGVPVNAMVIAGLAMAIALVVDDAIIGTTATTRRLRADGPGESASSRSASVIRATIDARGPMVYATLIIGLALAPFLLLGDVSGALLPPLLLAYVVALIVSMLVSLTVTPALSLLLLSGRPPQRRENGLARRIHDAYQRALTRLFSRSRPLFAIVGAVTIGVVVLFASSMAPGLGNASVPSFRDRDVLIHWDGPPGTSHVEMSRIVTAASEELRSISGVRNVGAHVGRALTSDQVVNVNSGELWVSIAPDADYDATLASVEEVVAGYPGLRRDVVTYAADRVGEVIAGRPNDVVVRIFGQDPEVMGSKAEEVRDLLAGIDGVTTAAVEPQAIEPTIEVQVDLEAASRYGLRPGEIRRAAATLLSGIEVGSLFEAQKVFEVVVWGVPELRQSLSSIEDLLIETPEDGLVALRDVAEVRITSAPTAIHRDAVQRRIDVGATVSGRDLSSVLADVESALATVGFPLENHAEILGFTSEQQTALAGLLAVAVAAAIGFFLLLQAAFASWRLAVYLFLAVPAALAGAVIVAFAIGDAGSLAAIAGLIAVLGITVRNGVALILSYRDLQRETSAGVGPDIALLGARERLGPTLVSVAATAAAFVPIVVLGSQAGLEVLQPLALVVLGGLVTSTLITLFIVPSLYLRSGMGAEPEEAAIPIEPAAEPQVIGAG
jgi:CzcA family heavy metal efflux pump